MIKSACKLKTEKRKSDDYTNTRSESSTLYVDLAIELHWENNNVSEDEGDSLA